MHEVIVAVSSKAKFRPDPKSQRGNNMNFAKRVLMFLCFVVLVAAVVSVLAPKATHALVATLVQVTNTSANPVPTHSMDAQNAFQTSFALGFDSVPVTIPSGQRLVIDFVSISGDAQSVGGPIQPDIIFNSTLTGGGSASYYLEPGSSPINIPGEGQVYLAQPVKIYADTLNVSGGYAGYAPSFFSFTVNISGHLVPIP